MDIQAKQDEIFKGIQELASASLMAATGIVTLADYWLRYQAVRSFEVQEQKAIEAMKGKTEENKP